MADNFPKDLLNWAGHREGGVKKPFHSSSGRPTGAPIETPVVSLLKEWVDSIAKGRSGTPTTILLIGGPGNGKTDAVEVLVAHLDEQLACSGKLVSTFASAYSPPGGQLPPRMVEVDLSQIAENLPASIPHRLRLVQDATERDTNRQDQSAACRFIDELGHVVSYPSNAIYICCANRGIISEALTQAKRLSASDQVHELLNSILEAVTLGPKSVSCWPLPNHPNVAAWPMDVDSLTESGSDITTDTVCRQIFRVALDPGKWPDTCLAGNKCPSCASKDLLSDDHALGSLIRLLRYYELGSGKRWTFRDLFSLVAYLLVGNEEDYPSRGDTADPCAWAHKQAEIARTERGTQRAFKSQLELMSRMYHHRLFPIWPSLRSGNYFKAQRELSRLDAKDLEPVKVLFSWLASTQRAADTEVVYLIRGSWSRLLDPALASGNIPLVEKRKTTYTVRDVEERFSLSVADGWELTKARLAPIENDVISELNRADIFLGGEDLPRNFSFHAKLLQGTLRQVCCRIVKRSIGTRMGICKDWHHFSAYHAAIASDDGLKEFRKQLQLLLHDDKNRFCSSLATTFGQPVPYRSRNVTLVTSKIPVKSVTRLTTAKRPAESMPYVRIKNHAIPVTFSLFSALREVGSGLRPSSLPNEIFTLIDATHSVVTGQVARDPEVLEEDVMIDIGGCRQRLAISEGRIEVLPAEE